MFEGLVGCRKNATKRGITFSKLLIEENGKVSMDGRHINTVKRLFNSISIDHFLLGYAVPCIL